MVRRVTSSVPQGAVIQELTRSRMSCRNTQSAERDLRRICLAKRGHQHSRAFLSEGRTPHRPCPGPRCSQPVHDHRRRDASVTVEVIVRRGFQRMSAFSRRVRCLRELRLQVNRWRTSQGYSVGCYDCSSHCHCYNSSTRPIRPCSLLMRRVSCTHRWAEFTCSVFPQRYERCDGAQI